MANESKIENLILTAIHPDEYARLLPNLEAVELSLGANLYKSGDIIEYVYFPRTALVSLVTHMKNGEAIEVAVIGKDGMVGIPVLLGDDIAFEEAVVQVAGSAVRMRSTVLKKTVQRRASPLLTLLLLYTRTLMKQVMQTAACNRLHSEKERLARWLLMCRDRMESDDLPLTQDFLSDVLGLPRATITNAATDIQTKRLEALACECYRVVTVSGHTSGLKSNSRSLRSTA